MADPITTVMQSECSGDEHVPKYTLDPGKDAPVLLGLIQQKYKPIRK